MLTYHLTLPTHRPNAVMNISTRSHPGETGDHRPNRCRGVRRSAAAPVGGSVGGSVAPVRPSTCVVTTLDITWSSRSWSTATTRHSDGFWGVRSGPEEVWTEELEWFTLYKAVSKAKPISIHAQTLRKNSKRSA